MPTNPYDSPQTVSRPRPTQPVQWTVRTGWALLGVALLCMIANAILLVTAYQWTANSITSKPSDLADGSAFSMIWSLVAIPIEAAGMILVVVGYARRKPAVDDSHP